MRKLTDDQTTMKILTIIFLLTLSFSLFGQDKIVGRYRDHFGSRIQLNSDKTFKYTWNFDLSASWTKGTWTMEGDTLYLHMIPTYDTLQHTSSKGKSSDTLIFSSDEIPERITPEQNAATVLSSGGQNRMAHPEKLVYRKGRLYKIINRKLLTKKQKGFWSGKKWDPWYFKSDD